MNVLLSVAVIALLCASSVVATSTKIAAGAIECFSENVELNGRLSFAFDVTAGGDQDLDVTLTATFLEQKPEESLDAMNRVTSLNHHLVTKEIERWTKAREGRATYDAPTTSEASHGLPVKVTACLSNKLSRWTPKWVSFSLNAEPGDPTADDKSVYTVESQLEHALHKEGTSLYHARSSLLRLRDREQQHRDQVESTNEWLLYGTIVNGVLLVAMSIFQYWYLKKFLSVRNVSMRM